MQFMYNLLSVCREGERPCPGTEDDPVCFSEDDYCDGTNQCPNGFDELNCGECFYAHRS